MQRCDELVIPDITGYLVKQGHGSSTFGRRSWQRRWYVHRRLHFPPFFRLHRLVFLHRLHRFVHSYKCFYIASFTNICLPLSIVCGFVASAAAGCAHVPRFYVHSRKVFYSKAPESKLVLGQFDIADIRSVTPNDDIEGEYVILLMVPPRVPFAVHALAGGLMTCPAYDIHLSSGKPI